MINVPVHALTTRCPLLTIDTIPEWSLRVPLAPQERVGDTIYVTQSRDSLPGIAWKFYNDPKLWWVIWDNNQGVLPANPIFLPEGVSLRIPSKQAVESELIHDGHQV